MFECIYLFNTHYSFLCPLKIQADNRFRSSFMMLHPEIKRKYPIIQPLAHVALGNGFLRSNIFK